MQDNSTPEQIYQGVTAPLETIQPGTLKKSLEGLSEPGKKEYLPQFPQTEYLIVLGQGIVDPKTGQKPTGKEKIDMALDSWSQTAGCAAGELYIAGMTKKIILSGGKPDDFNVSQARLVKDILIKKYKVPEENIILEEESLNTLENYAFSLNKIDSLAKDFNKDSVGILAVDFQIARARELAYFFGLKNPQAYSAEQVVKLIAQLTNNQNLHNFIDQRLDIVRDLSLPETRFQPAIYNKDGTILKRSEWEILQDPNTKREEKEALGTKSKTSSNAKTYYENQQGVEARGIVDRKRFEHIMTRGLLEEKRYWYGYLGLLDEPRLRYVLNSLPPQELDFFGLRPDSHILQIREAFAPYRMDENKIGRES